MGEAAAEAALAALEGIDVGIEEKVIAPIVRASAGALATGGKSGSARMRSAGRTGKVARLSPLQSVRVAASGDGTTMGQ